MMSYEMMQVLFQFLKYLLDSIEYYLFQFCSNL